MQYTYPCTKEEHLFFKDGKVSLPQRSLMEKYINFTSSECGAPKKRNIFVGFFHPPFENENSFLP